MKKQRIWELDAFRGICILGMIVVHAVLDIKGFGSTGNAVFDFVREWGSLLFILISGICLTLGSKSLRRGLIVFAAGMLCTLVTWGMYKVGMEGEGSASVRISSARLTDIYLRPDGQYVDGHMALELSCVSVGSVEVRRVDSIELDEENGFDLSQYPAVTLVRAGDETMWELAKEYHSSVEKISAANQTEDAVSAGLLLLPKCV